MEDLTRDIILSMNQEQMREALLAIHADREQKRLEEYRAEQARKDEAERNAKLLDDFFNNKFALQR